MRLNAGIPGQGWWAWSSTDGKALRGVEPLGEHKLKIAFRRPCLAELPEEGHNTYLITFTIVDGKLWVDRGGAGFVDGADALLCGANPDAYFVLEHGQCTQWVRDWRDGKVSGKAASCAFEQKDGERVLVVDGARFRVKGNALVSEAAASHPEEEMRPAKSFADAKAQRDKLDPPQKK